MYTYTRPERELYCDWPAHSLTEQMPTPRKRAAETQPAADNALQNEMRPKQAQRSAAAARQRAKVQCICQKKPTYIKRDPRKRLTYIEKYL